MARETHGGHADADVGVDGLKIRDDPEAIFQEGRFLCDVGEHRRDSTYLQTRRCEGLLGVADASTQPRVRRAARRP